MTPFENRVADALRDVASPASKRLPAMIAATARPTHSTTCLAWLSLVRETRSHRDKYHLHQWLLEQIATIRFVRRFTAGTCALI